MRPLEQGNKQRLCILLYMNGYFDRFMYFIRSACFINTVLYSVCFCAGHTHGGQLFPMVIFAYLFNPFFAGLYCYRHGHVYVTQGAVYWGIPMRMFSKAEITQVFLLSA